MEEEIQKLKEMYVIQELSMLDISKILGIKEHQVRNKLIKNNISLRSQNCYTKNRIFKLKNNKNLGEKSKEYFTKIKTTGILPPNEIIRREKLRNFNLGKKLSEEHKKKIGKTNKQKIHPKGLFSPKYGVHCSEKGRLNIAQATKKRYKEGCLSPMAGRRHSEETILKCRQSHIGTQSTLYKNGNAYKIYPKEYHVKRKEILLMDECCLHCGSKQDRLIVHHLNGNKKDSNIDNLATVCMLCHFYLHKLNIIKKQEFNQSLYEKAQEKRKYWKNVHNFFKYLN